MYNMPVSSNYFRYFAVPKKYKDWGLGVSAAGFTRVPPGSAYPPVEHPASHELDWRRGRVIDALQIVLISAGRGWFQSHASGKCAIAAGAGFAVLPGVWHRYRPDPATGWEESWIELQGPVIKTLIQSGELSPESCVRKGALAAGIDAALDALHRRARLGSGAFDPVLAAHGLTVLALWSEAKKQASRASRVQSAITQAESYLAENLGQPVNILQLSRKLGIAYSHFRKEFQSRTGFAPWQYVLHLRLREARRLLAISDEPLERVAERIGFGSASHLSRAFKKSFGHAPRAWRKSIQLES